MAFMLYNIALLVISRFFFTKLIKNVKLFRHGLLVLRYYVDRNYNLESWALSITKGAWSLKIIIIETWIIKAWIIELIGIGKGISISTGGAEQWIIEIIGSCIGTT